MNAGLQDAANLGWKLASAVHGWAPVGLLDSYHTERYPVGRAVLRGSGALLRLTLAQSQATRAARWLLADVVGRFGSPPALVSRAVSGIGIAYATPRGEHRLVGRRAPDIRLVPGKAGNRIRSGGENTAQLIPSTTTEYVLLPSGRGEALPKATPRFPKRNVELPWSTYGGNPNPHLHSSP
jgi:hypothetical protein